MILTKPKTMKKLILILPIFIFTIACGNSEKSNAEKSSVDESIVEESSIEKEVISTKKTDLSPCKLLTEAEIKTALSIPADAETSIKEKNTTFPVCIYKWESITFPIEKHGLTIDYPAELNIVLVQDANKKMYEKSVSYYKDGKPENGVGDMATWSEKRHQITFLAKGMLIHVNSRISDDSASNKTNAIKIANMIIDKL